MIDLELSFTAELWVYTGPGAWHFLTLPTEAAEQIKFFREKHYGFGTIRVRAVIENTEWQTSLFPDKASGSFLLPVKAGVRKKEGLLAGNQVEVVLFVDHNMK